MTNVQRRAAFQARAREAMHAQHISWDEACRVVSTLNPELTATTAPPGMAYSAERRPSAEAANGDYLGHEFHGNQYVGAEKHAQANELSRKAHFASADAKDRASHVSAQAAHQKAADAHKAAGNDDAADAHLALVKYHAGRANRFK